MTTKDFCSSPLFKSPKFGDTGNQYNNLNLNSSVNHSLCNLGPSKKNRVILIDTNSKFGQDEGTKSRYSNKFSSGNFFTKSFDFVNYKEEKEDGVAWKKPYSSENGRGLLSLHIPPQENSDIDVAYDKGRKWKTSKQYFEELTLSAAFKNSFEFPRQQEGGDKLHIPEIMKFKTSQQLLNPATSSVATDNNNSHPKHTLYMPSQYTAEKYCFEYNQAAANSIKPNFMESSYIFSKLSETAIEVFKKKTASQMEAEKIAVLESDDFDKMFTLQRQFDDRVLLSNNILPLGPDEETWLGMKFMLQNKWCAFKIYSAEDNSIQFYPVFGQFKGQTAVRVLKTPECPPCTNFDIGFVYMDKQMDDLKSIFGDLTAVEFKNIKICEPEPPVPKVPITSSLLAICFEKTQMEVSVKLSNSHDYRHALKILFDDEDSYSCDPNELIIESEQEASVTIKKLKNNARDSKLQIAYKPVYDGETPIEDILFSSTDDILTIPVKSTQ